MPNYRRNLLPGGTFFFTIVVLGRRPILADASARSLLRQAMLAVRRDKPFGVEAMVLLPDHLHVIWRLPPGDADFPARWSKTKSLFTRRWLAAGGPELPVSAGKGRDRRRGVLQPHYYEHTIRDEEEFIQHVEYIHYNPVRHGYVQRPRDWAWSSFHRYTRLGYYPIDWCCGLNVIPPDSERVDMEHGE
jgi:putative transposase